MEENCKKCPCKALEDLIRRGRENEKITKETLETIRSTYAVAKKLESFGKQREAKASKDKAYRLGLATYETTLEVIREISALSCSICPNLKDFYSEHKKNYLRILQQQVRLLNNILDDALK